MIYDLSLHFDLNKLAFHLDNLPANYSLNHCALEDCIREIMTQSSISLNRTRSFLVFNAPGRRYQVSKDRKLRLGALLSKKRHPKLEVSYHQAPLHEVLSKVLERLGDPLDLANGIQGKISLHLNRADAFEVLFHLVEAHKLRVIAGENRPLLAPPQPSPFPK